jgi:hypothetical protein
MDITLNDLKMLIADNAIELHVLRTQLTAISAELAALKAPKAESGTPAA